MKLDNEESELEQDDEDLPNFPKALYDYVTKRNKKVVPRKPPKQPNPFMAMRPQAIAKLKYTNDIWRDLP